MLGETVVTLKDGRTVTGLDVALGSISGIELAIRESERDYSSLFTRMDDYENIPNYAPWAFNADVRRMMMDAGRDPTAPDAIASEAGLASGAFDKGFGGGERIAPAPELSVDAPISTTQYGDVLQEDLAPSLPSGDAVMAEAVRSRTLDLQTRRWWSQHSYAVPQEGQPGDTLTRLMGRLGASQTIEQDRLQPRGQDRAIPVDPDLARNAGQLREAMATFAARRTGSDWRRNADAAEATRNALAPSIWRQKHRPEPDRQSVA